MSFSLYLFHHLASNQWEVVRSSLWFLHTRVVTDYLIEPTEINIWMSALMPCCHGSSLAITLWWHHSRTCTLLMRYVLIYVLLGHITYYFTYNYLAFPIERKQSNPTFSSLAVTQRPVEDALLWWYFSQFPAGRDHWPQAACVGSRHVCTSSSHMQRWDPALNGQQMDWELNMNCVQRRTKGDQSHLHKSLILKISCKQQGMVPSIERPACTVCIA